MPPLDPPSAAPHLLAALQGAFAAAAGRASAGPASMKVRGVGARRGLPRFARRTAAGERGPDGTAAPRAQIVDKINAKIAKGEVRPARACEPRHHARS